MSQKNKDKSNKKNCSEFLASKTGKCGVGICAVVSTLFMLLYCPLGINIHKEGKYTLAVFAVLSILAFVYSNSLGIIMLVLTLCAASFFRDPERVTPEGSNLIISPADGVVQSITEEIAPPETGLGDEPLTRVSIFLSVFNVHVNRMPCSSNVLKSIYYPGKFFNASLDKASKYNERQTTIIETEHGKQRLIVVQIAGLIARRIVTYIEEGQHFSAGERFGIIKFGSRVDLYLPKSIKIDVLPGQIMVGGETVIAKL